MKFPLAASAAVLAAVHFAPASMGAAAPTDLQTAASRFVFPDTTTGSVVEVTYRDHADDEDGFELQLSPDGSTGWTTIDTRPANATYARVEFNEGALTGTHFARVRALSSTGGDSAWTAPVALTVPSTMGIRTPIFAGAPSGATGAIGPSISIAAGPPPWAWSATDLPPGMAFDPDTGVISGPLPAPGVYRPRIEVFDGVSTGSTFITLRVIPASSGPVAAGPGYYLALDPASPFTIDLDDHFNDPDTSLAVRVATNLGNIDTIMFPEATPATVANFMNYVDDGDYTGAIFHRSVTTATAGVDIIQAGLMGPSGSGGYTTVPLDPQVVNEPGLPNNRGTIAVAKQGGNPDSGTSQWYFNVNANSGLNSRNNNGGFAVFGRAATGSLPVMDDIWGRPTGTYPAEINGTPIPLPNWPTTVVPAGAAPALDELIRISSAQRIPPLDYDLTTNSNPALGTAVLDGSEILFTPAGAATGSTQLSLEITDLDGNVLLETLSVCILTLNIAEGFSPGEAFTVSFDHEKVAEFHYQVQRSIDLLTWTKVWDTSDGLADPAVLSQSDLGAQWRITVEDTASSPPVPAAAYLRIVVTKSP